MCINWNKEEKTDYFLNCFNSDTVHAVCSLIFSKKGTEYLGVIHFLHVHVKKRNK